ncbi:MAG: SCO family protein [Geminicoccaceae bacterium]
MRRWIIPLALALIVVGGGAYLYVRATEVVPAANEAVPIGGDFTLVDQNGRTVTQADFRGKWMLVYFGYTYCPDICPLGLQTIAAAIDDLPAEVAGQLVPVFITVDPARDTPEVMQAYVGQFHPALVGLTGTQAQVDAAVKAWRVYARKGEVAQDGTYLMDHSTFTYLMDPEGRYATHFGHDATPEAMAAKIKQLVTGTTS